MIYTALCCTNSNTYDDFLFISVWSSTTLDIARMICAIILLTIICNVFVILFVYFFVGSGAAATFIPCPFSHGYRAVCECVINEWGSNLVVSQILLLICRSSKLLHNRQILFYFARGYHSRKGTKF